MTNTQRLMQRVEELEAENAKLRVVTRGLLESRRRSRRPTELGGWPVEPCVIPYYQVRRARRDGDSYDWDAVDREMGKLLSTVSVGGTSDG